MKNLELPVAATKRDLDDLGVPYRTVLRYTVNTRAKKRWGQCKKVRQDSFEIELSVRLLADNVPDQCVQNVLAHELLHTVPGCFCHRGLWKAWAQKINRALPQYRIQTTDSGADMGLPLPATPAKYRIACTACDFTAFRIRRSKVIDSPQRYRCPKCGGNLRVQTLQK